MSVIKDCFLNLLDRWRPPKTSRPWKPGQRVALVWPKDRCLVIRRRWRLVRDEGRDAQRLASYLCCPEPLRFVGSICTYNFLKHKGDHNVPSELYLGASGAMYLWTDHIYSDSLTFVAESITEFLNIGLRRCNFITVPEELPHTASLRALAGCMHIHAFAQWRATYRGRLMVMGDYSVIRVSTIRLYDWSEINDWRVMVGSNHVEPLGWLVSPYDVINLFVDDCMRVFAANNQHVCIVADSLMEFVIRGMTRCHENGIYYGTRSMRKLNKPTCPYGVDHQLFDDA